ncbi:unnamed protein product [Lota lota]
MEASTAPLTTLCATSDPQETHKEEEEQEEEKDARPSASSEDDHLLSLKALTEKLHLQTRRPSYLEWQAHVESPSFGSMGPLAPPGGWPGTQPGDKGSRPSKGPMEEEVEEEETTTAATAGATSNDDGGIRFPSGLLRGFGNMDEALTWLRKELAEMRVQDQQLARQLMRLRADIHKLKIEQMCHLHRRMLNDATFGMEERDELSDLLCECPVTPGLGLSAPLRLIGVTKMNINSRRFSLC